MTTDEIVLYKNPDFYIVRTMGNGEAFGEIALRE